MKLHQKGFTLIEGLLIIIALTMVTGVGYYVYSQSQDTKQPKVNTSQSDKDTSAPSKDEYIEFKLMGIKVKNTDELKDITFEEKSTENGALLQYSNKKVGELFRECVSKNREVFVEPDADKTVEQIRDIVGGITRVNGSYAVDVRNRMSSSSTLLKDLGDFYLEAPSGPSPCIALDDETTDDAFINESQRVIEAVKDVFKNAEEL